MSLMSPYQIVSALDRVDSILSHSDQWTHGAGARDSEGKKLRNPLDKNAVCWCLRGAVWKAVNGNSDDSAQVLAALREVTPRHISVGEFNDVSVFQQIKDAIAKAKIAASVMDPWIPPESANSGIVLGAIMITAFLAAGLIAIK